MLAAVDRKGKLQVEEGEGRKKTVKDEKEGKRKAMAGKEFNWAMLYMNVRRPYTTTQSLFSCILMRFASNRATL